MQSYLNTFIMNYMRLVVVQNYYGAIPWWVHTSWGIIVGVHTSTIFLSLLGLVEIHACNKWNKITYGHMITQGASMHLHQKKGLKVLSISRILQLCKSRQRFLPSCMLNVDQPKGGNFKSTSGAAVACFILFLDVVTNCILST